MSPRLPEPIYVSGPMTYYPEDNYPAFCDACEKLRALGYEVHSPHEVKFEGSDALQGDDKWQAFIRADLVLLLRCKSVVCLPDWEFSRGAVLECHIANALRMRIIPLRLALELK